MLPFDKVKRIKPSIKCMVFGYIRNCQALLPTSAAYYQIPKIAKHIILLFYYSSIESQILTDTECDELCKLFQENNKFSDLGQFEYNLIYASYNDGIGEKIFREKCHEKENILCIWKTSKKANEYMSSKQVEVIDAVNIWGGYTSTGWGDLGTKYSKNEQDKNAFLFTIRSSQNYPAQIFNCIHPNRALTNQRQYYGIFGTGLDCACWINHTGIDGGSYGQSKNYEKFPIEDQYYFSEVQYFAVIGVEVFQLK